MIRVTVGNNLKRSAVVVPPTTTLRQVLVEAGIDFNLGTTNLDGDALTPDELEMTFADHGVTDSCYLLNVAKADNAAGVA